MKKITLSLMLCMLVPVISCAQSSREFIRNKISGWGTCKNVSITKTNGDVAIYAENGWAGTGLPDRLSKALHELNEESVTINEVELSEDGAWCVVYGKNGYRSSGLPTNMVNKLSDYNDEGYEITSVAFNDSGRWIIVCKEYYVSSAQWIQDWLSEGCDKYGQLWSVAISGDAMVAVYDRGYRYYGDIPSDLKEALKESNLDVYRVKIAGDAWFFADKEGHFRYKM